MIDRLPSGKYRVRIYHRSRYVASRSFGRRKDAADWERRQMDALAAGTWVAPSESSITVGEWVERWWTERRPVKPSTATRYESLLRLHLLPEWRRRPLSSVAPSEVQGWATRLVGTHSVSTARQAVGLLRQAFGAMIRTCGWPSAGERETAHLPEEDLVTEL